MKKGFTLIELLVVVLIIGILSAIALPQYQRAVEKAHSRQALIFLKALVEAEQAFYMTNGAYTNDFDTLDIHIPFVGNVKWISGDKFNAKSSDEWSAMLENSEGTTSILVGRLGGTYDKKVGFAYYFQYDNLTSIPIGRMLCMELPSLSPSGAYCQRTIGATYSTSSASGTRLYLLTE